MPLTLTLTEGVIPAGTEKQAFVRLCKSMLKWNQLTGSKAMIANTTGSVHVLPRKLTFSGMEETSGAWIEWVVPSFVFNARRIREGYFADATDIMHEISGGKLPVEQIWINIVHTADGAWSLDGHAMTNKQLVQAILGEQPE